MGRITGSLRESIDNAESFRAAEKERIREIQHNANSDMPGRKADAHRKDSWKDTNLKAIHSRRGAKEIICS